MRLTGFVLLIVGALLCSSLAGAGVGFVTMSVGLICLLVSEDRKKVAALLSAPEAAVPQSEAFRSLSSNGISREVPGWSALVANDVEIARVVRVLTPFGQKYVDQLATTYLIFNEKTYLPTILNMIIASARKDAGLSPIYEFGSGYLDADNPDLIASGKASGRYGISPIVVGRSDPSTGGRDRPAQMSNEKATAAEGATEARNALLATGATTQKKPIDDIDELKRILGRFSLMSSDRQGDTKQSADLP